MPIKLKTLEYISDLFCINESDLIKGEGKPLLTAFSTPVKDWDSLISFHRIVRNYLKIERLLKRQNP